MIDAPHLDGQLLGQLGERRIYSELLEPHYRSVPAFGDDCAAVGRDLVVTTDSCSEALVASLGMADPYYTGWLLATINLSDLAAAGARPQGLVVNYTLPPHTPVGTLKRIIDGVDDCATRHGTQVLGGDIRDGHAMHLSATAIGRCPRRISRFGPTGSRLSRRGAHDGDRLLLVGSPGYLWAAALLHGKYAVVGDAEQADVNRRAREPTAQVEAGRILARRGLARAAIDVSDGLYAGVRTLCETNRLGALMESEIELDAVLRKICMQAKVSTFQLGQTWGDWSLLVAVRPRDVRAACRLLAAADIGVREVGRLTRAAGDLRVDDGGADPPPWDGVDQERFSERSWNGEGIDAAIQRMREAS